MSKKDVLVELRDILGETSQKADAHSIYTGIAKAVGMIEGAIAALKNDIPKSLASAPREELQNLPALLGTVVAAWTTGMTHPLIGRLGSAENAQMGVFVVYDLNVDRKMSAHHISPASWWRMDTTVQEIIESGAYL